MAFGRAGEEKSTAKGRGVASVVSKGASARGGADDRYRLLFEQAAGSTLVLNADGRGVLDASLKACEALGGYREDILVAGPDGTFEPDDRRVASIFEQFGCAGAFMSLTDVS